MLNLIKLAFTVFCEFLAAPPALKLVGANIKKKSMGYHPLKKSKSSALLFFFFRAILF